MNTSAVEGNGTRPRRYYSQSGILVPGQGKVVYEGQEVVVRIGGVVIQSFPGITVLQVYNDIEGPLTFFSSANGRTFPGYGKLLIETPLYIGEYSTTDALIIKLLSLVLMQQCKLGVKARG